MNSLSEAEPNVLPPYATLIDASYRALFTKYGLEGPTCHVGSLLNSERATQADVDSWRCQFTEMAPGGFVGIDLLPGLNVDVVADLCSATFATDHPSLVQNFGVVFCSALLEHVANPFAAAENIGALVRPGGHIFCAGPWVQGYHPYPEDYWRINHAGFRALFPGFEWLVQWYSGSRQGVGIVLDNPNYERKLFRSQALTGAGALLTDRALAYLNVGLIGRRL
jgi:hypothetical protein